jgi:hypothetical protein
MPDAATLVRAHAFLEQHGTKQTPHGSRLGDLTHGSFDDHLRGTCTVLERWGYSEPVCLAGLFHSIYGTEGFQGLVLSLSQRGDVAELIGARAECAAFFNCVMDRDSLDCIVAEHVVEGLGVDTRPRLPLRARNGVDTGMAGGEQWQLTPEALHDLMAVHLADYCEGWRNNHINPSVRFLRHAKGGQPGYYRIPPGGQHAYRYEAYSACATLLGGAALVECALMQPATISASPTNAHTWLILCVLQIAARAGCCTQGRN